MGTGLAFLLTLAGILLPPALAVLLCRLGLRAIDDRGLYAVSPFLFLPIAAGGLLEGWLLASTDLIRLLAPSAIWSELRFWHLGLRGLYQSHLAPPVLLDLARIAAGVGWDHWPRDWPWLLAYGLAFLPGAVMSGFAWRSWRALPAALLFVPISLTSALVVHHLIFIAFWLFYWLNFWLFFIFVALIEMRRHDRENTPVLAP